MDSRYKQRHGKEVEEESGTQIQNKDVKRIISNGDGQVEYTLQLEDRDKFLNLRALNTSDSIIIIIPDGVFENGDVIEGYEHFGNKNVKIKTNQGYMRSPRGSLNSIGEITLDGYFKIRITNNSTNGGINGDSSVFNGDYIAQYDVKQSPDGTFWKVGQVDNSGNIIAPEAL